MKIIFEFVGGPMDGKTVVGQVGQQDEADRYYVLTHRGRIGQRFRVASKYAIDLLAQEELKEEKRHYFQQHRYEVTDRVEGDEEVLVRVQYVEREEGHTRKGRAAASAQPSSIPDPSIEQQIGDIIHATAKSMGESYSHCWPAEDSSVPCAAVQNLALHLGHVLLQENFSVFSPAVHPLASARSVDLLGLAPSQDWFLASALAALRVPASLDELAQRAAQLETFWLDPRLTIEPCRGHIASLANHCQNGYGLLMGLHNGAGAATIESEILSFWKTHGRHASSPNVLVSILARRNAQWGEPLVVRAFGQQRVYYLLSAIFKIPRNPNGSER